MKQYVEGKMKKSKEREHIYFGNMVYGGQLINKSKIKKKGRTLLRKLVISPSEELIDIYNLKKEKDATPQGFIEVWIPNRFIDFNLLKKKGHGRRTLVRSTFDGKKTALFKGVR